MTKRKKLNPDELLNASNSAEQRALTERVMDRFFAPAVAKKEIKDQIEDRPDPTITTSPTEIVATQDTQAEIVVSRDTQPATMLPDKHVAPRDTRQTTISPGEDVRWYKTPNYLDDEIMPGLTPVEQVVLRRLFRLSYGFNREVTDSVSLKKLGEKCNVKQTSLYHALNSLEQRGLIERYSDITHNPGGGNRYRVMVGILGGRSSSRGKIVEGQDSQRASRSPGENIKDLKKQYLKILNDCRAELVGAGREETRRVVERECGRRGIPFDPGILNLLDFTTS